MGLVSMGVPEDITVELAKLNKSRLFIETGTFVGGTARWAAKHFESVHTIERAEGIYRKYSDELGQIEGITPHLGDSRDLLPKILKSIGDQRCVFWLDGHWSGGDTAGQDDECPLLDELACLSGRPDDIILIDDARLFLCAPPLPHDPTQWPTISEILFTLRNSRQAPFVQVIDDVIFIIPDDPTMKSCLVRYAQKRADSFLANFSTFQKAKSSRHHGLRGRLKKILGE